MLISATDIRKNIEESRRRLDAAEAYVVPIAQDDPVQYSDQLDDLLKTNIALKTLEVMGQVLRNYAGALRKGEDRNCAGSLPTGVAYTKCRSPHCGRRPSGPQELYCPVDW